MILAMACIKGEKIITLTTTDPNALKNENSLNKRALSTIISIINTTPKA